MSLLDTQRLAEIAGRSSEFLGRKPYPWAEFQGVLKDDAFRTLCADLPRPDLFQPEFGKARGYGQQSHDRYALQYRSRLDADLAPSWRAFVGELQSEPYQSWVRAMWGIGPRERFVLSMHWHDATRGGSVSPHTDARRKFGSHIFYFNTSDDWDLAWGGQTVVLDDEGRHDAHSAPAFGELREVAKSNILGNRSFIFKRTEHSWHAVNPVTCPSDRLRRIFIVVVNRVNLQVLWRRLRGKDADGYRL